MSGAADPQHRLFALEAALWDTVLRPSLRDGSGPARDARLGQAAVARVLRRIDRVFGRSGCVSAAEVRARFAGILEDRDALERLRGSPGIEQRTPAWYRAREGLITASDFAQAMGEGKFGTQRDFFVKKVAPSSLPAFPSSLPPLKWGVMFEPVATELYRARNGGVRVHEFGLVQHPRLPHLGASPDGITDTGVMVEVKCPYARRITGEVPYQYFCQIQGQLEVCGLRHCDYLECEFGKYADEAEFLGDGEGEGLSGEGREKGAIAEFAAADGDDVRYDYYSPSSSGGGGGGGGDDDDDFRAQYARWKAGLSASPGTAPRALHFWHLKTYSVVRVQLEPDMLAHMLAQLEGVWARVNAYRADPEAFRREVLDAAPVRRSSSSRPPPTVGAMGRGRGGGDGGGGRGGGKGPAAPSPRVPAEYAFVDEEDG